MSNCIPLESRQASGIMTRGGRPVLAWPVICWVILLTLQGCGPSRELISLEIRKRPQILAATVPESRRLKVAVAPFEDQRIETGRIGTRVDWFGAQTPVTIEGGSLGDMLAERFVEYLKRRHGWDAWIVKPGVVPPDGGPDVVLSGTVVAFAAEAVSGFAVTDLTVTTELHIITGRQPVDQQSTPVTVKETESDWVFRFDPRDLEVLLDHTLLKGMDQFMLQVVLEGRS